MSNMKKIKDSQDVFICNYAENGTQFIEFRLWKIRFRAPGNNFILVAV